MEGHLDINHFLRERMLLFVNLYVRKELLLLAFAVQRLVEGRSGKASPE